MKITTYNQGNSSAPALFVVHGGPGLDHSYLLAGLKPFSGVRHLVFYDQLACGADRTKLEHVTIQATVEQLVELVRDRPIQKEYGIIAHSWGTHIALSALPKLSDDPPSELILVTPMALDYEAYQRSGARLMSRFSKPILDKAGELENNAPNSNAPEVMAFLLPQYLSPKNTRVRIEFPHYNPKLNAKLLDALGNYDVRPIVLRSKQRTLVIYGRDDFESAAENPGFAASGATVHTIANSGHFPFAEQSERFVSLVLRFLGRE